MKGGSNPKVCCPRAVTRWAIHGLSARRLGCVDLGSRRSSDRLKNRFATFSGKVYPFSFISTEGPTNQKPKHRQDREGCRHPFAVPVDSLPCGSFAGALPRFVMLRIEHENAANFLN